MTGPYAAVPQTWAVRSARLYTGHELLHGSPLVVVSGTRVARVQTGAAEPPPGVPVVDLGDVTLLPGLIDSHVHLAFAAEDTDKAALAALDETTILARMRRHARQQLDAGVTTIRDLGDRAYLALRLRDEAAAAAGADPMPEILVSGPPITRARGHCWFLGGEADGGPGVASAVAERSARGVNVVKIMATGGAITPGWGPHESQYTLAELTMATRAAHACGLPIVAHAHGPQGITDAVAAGVDGIEHLSFFTADGIAVNWDVVLRMADAGVFVGATEAWLPSGEMVAPHLAGRLAQRTENFARMWRAGVRLVCCSDAGAGPRKPHGVLAHGIVRFGSMGMTNAEAIGSATGLAALACGLADRKGRVAPGYDADLIAVAGDPLSDLQALFQVRAVIREGRPVRGVTLAPPR